MTLVGERRALAAAVMLFYSLIYAAVALTGQAPEAGPAFVAIAGVYGLAFFSLVAGYFWARWYAVGVGLFGVIQAGVGLWQLGAEPVLIFLGSTHLAATVMLWGRAMSGPYDGQLAWRERFHMDEHAVQRLGRSVIRAGVSLPLVLLYALMPRPESLSLGCGAALAGVAAGVLAGAGLRGLIRLRTWSLVALAAAGGLLLALAGAELATVGIATAASPTIAGVLLLAAVAPYAGAVARWLRPAAR